MDSWRSHGGDAWRIDTLDPRGGLAFATWGYKEGKSSHAEPYCIFVGAPHFQPEPVANRAIALAAGRGAFQTGLFVNDTEVPFPTPDAVAEFVRRVYLRSGGGDGTDGGGGEAPPPILPEGRPDLPLVPELGERESGDRPLAYAILNDIRTLSKKSSGLTLGSIEECRWSKLSRGEENEKRETATDGPSMLGSAAVILIHEMLRRLPLAGNPAALATWQRYARALGSLFTYLGLWRLLLTQPYYSSVQHTISKLLPQTN